VGIVLEAVLGRAEVGIALVPGLVEEHIVLEAELASVGIGLGAVLDRAEVRIALVPGLVEERIVLVAVLGLVGDSVLDLDPEAVRTGLVGLEELCWVVRQCCLLG
jgi:hypothetical protein